jgi:hypothetical protein
VDEEWVASDYAGELNRVGGFLNMADEVPNPVDAEAEAEAEGVGVGQLVVLMRRRMDSLDARKG